MGLPMAIVLEIVVIDLANLMCFDFNNFSLFSLTLGSNHGLQTVDLTRFQVSVKSLRMNIFGKDQCLVDLIGIEDFPA